MPIQGNIRYRHSETPQRFSNHLIFHDYSNIKILFEIMFNLSLNSQHGEGVGPQSQRTSCMNILCATKMGYFYLFCNDTVFKLYLSGGLSWKPPPYYINIIYIIIFDDIGFLEDLLKYMVFFHFKSMNYGRNT